MEKTLIIKIFILPTKNSFMDGKVLNFDKRVFDTL